MARLVRLWRERTGHGAISLIVAHTHEHGDHTGGDADLAALRIPELAVTVTPLDLEATKQRFGIASWPERAKRFIEEQRNARWQRAPAP